jgi:DNA-binding beta-propeller fold protein YncE
MKNTCLRFRYIGFLILFTLAFPVRGDLLVTRPGNSGAHTAVLCFNEANGTYMNEFSADSEGFYGVTIGPDDHVYVTGNTLGYGDVFRFTASGALTGKFANRNLTVPGSLKFGPDGNLYVTSIVFPDSSARGQVLRYNGVNGSFIDAFISAGSGGLANPVDVLFCQNEFVCVGDLGLGVLRYRAANGAFVDNFIPAGRGGLNSPTAMTLGPDGHLYLCNRDNNAVLHYHSGTGEFLGAFVTSGNGGLSGPAGLAFGPDGHLYVSSRNTHSVLRYNGTNGAFMGVFVSSAAGGLRSPTSLAFTARPCQLTIQRAGSQTVIRWPAAFSNYTLTCKTGLAASSWAAVAQRPVQTGAYLYVTNDLAGSACFYRLQRP